MNSSNLTNNISGVCNDSFDSQTLKGFKAAAYCTTWVMSFVGNSLLLIVVYRNRKIQTTLNIVIGNMAVSDLLLILFGIPQQVFTLYKDAEVGFTFHYIMCKFTPFTNGVSTAVSMMSLLVIAIERFQAIVFPMRSRVIKAKKCYAIIALCWLIGICFSSFNLFTFRMVRDGRKYLCYYDWKPYADKEEGMKNYTISYFVCFIAIPFSMLIVLYTVLICSLQRQNSVVSQMPEARKRRERENRNVIYMLVTIVFVFILSWSPYLIVDVFLFIFYYNFILPCQLYSFAFFAQLLSYLYTVLNPLIYYLFSKNYRHSFQQLLCCRKSSNGEIEFNIGLS